MLINILLTAAAIWIFKTWLAGLCVAVLFVIWRLLPAIEGPPVLALTMTVQWVQVTCGLFFVAVTGRTLPATEDSNWEPMVIVGLVSVLSVSIGLAGGIAVMRRNMHFREYAAGEIVTFRTLMMVYGAAIVLNGILQEVAWQFPMLTQGILALSFIRLGILSLVLRRLTQPKLQIPMMFALLAFEVALGFTGFFSDFKEPILLAVLAILEVFDRKRAAHWGVAVALVTVLSFMFVMWMGVRGEFREDFDDAAFAASRSARLDRMQALSTDWFNQRNERMMDDMEHFVDRAWAVYFPALTMERVPKFLPHTDGQLMRDVIVHLVTPRLFFPNKPPLPNESEFVRRFAGVYVSGAEQGTTFAFGYAAESYVDYGIPRMFIPMLIFGFVMGCAFEFLLRIIAHREIAISLVTCIFWVNMYQFERSWSKMIGLSLTMMAYTGGVAFLIDRYLLLRKADQAERDAMMRGRDTAYGGFEP